MAHRIILPLSVFGRFLIIAFAVVLLGWIAAAAHADEELFGWDASGLSNFGPSPWAPTTAPLSGLSSVAGLARGTNLKTGTSPLAGWGGFGWIYGSETDAVAGNTYLTFGFTVAQGDTVSLSNISESYRRGSGGPDVGEFTYSLDGTNFVNVAGLTFGAFSSGQTTLIDLSGVAGLQHLTDGTTVTFRQANWHSTGTDPGNSSASWFIYDTNIPGDDFSVLVSHRVGILARR